MSSRLSGHDFDVEKPGVEFEGADSERYCDCIQGEPRGIQSGKRENAMALSQGCLYLSRQPSYCWIEIEGTMPFPWLSGKLSREQWRPCER